MTVRIILIYILLSIPVSAFADTTPLKTIDEDLQAKHPDINHISTEELDAMLKGPTKPILIDVRNSKEYAVSKIEGAIRIRPGASSREISSKLKKLANGKEIVFYCSVGVRSSRLADRTKVQLMQLGASGVHNLRGGIFAWHNETRPLINDTGNTNFVHPYNRSWGRLLKRKAFVSTKPHQTRDN